jgi:hypothetical protein
MLQQGEDEHFEEAGAGKPAFPLRAAGRFRQFIQRFSENRLHRRSHLGYDSHREAPSFSMFLWPKSRWFKDFPLLLKDQFP